MRPSAAIPLFGSGKFRVSEWVTQHRQCIPGIGAVSSATEFSF